jgi:hypothetical protein
MIVHTEITPGLRFLLVPLMAILAAGVGRELSAQGVATIQVAENLRAEPQGAIIGRLMVGASFSVVSRRDLWVEVEVEGWMWTPSLQTTDRAGYDLMVSVAPGENLRSEPQGDVLAVLSEGALLEELDATTGWKRVRRIAWVWSESVDVEGEEAPAERVGATETAPGTPVSGDVGGWLRSGGRGRPLLSVPDGDTLARTLPGADLRILAREGNWVRVRLEGWIWAPEGGSQTDAMDSAAVNEVAPAEVTPAEVTGDPDAYRGRVVSWELQFVSLERAEKIRTDFYEGEPFLLTRTSTSAGAFVYVAIPPERLQELEGLVPLERIRVVGRIRTGAAALTGNPILDLLELTRISRD